ncbi:MAG: hypothetical protein HY726_01920 [Candidatus Rokubacteria bacterium]|nr:hypothetical protein [Candidatus Rokubacteria bacterium]
MPAPFLSLEYRGLGTAFGYLQARESESVCLAARWGQRGDGHGVWITVSSVGKKYRTTRISPDLFIDNIPLKDYSLGAF